MPDRYFVTFKNKQSSRWEIDDQIFASPEQASSSLLQDKDLDIDAFRMSALREDGSIKAVPMIGAAPLIVPEQQMSKDRQMIGAVPLRDTASAQAIKDLEEASKSARASQVAHLPEISKPRLLIHNYPISGGDVTQISIPHCATPLGICVSPKGPIFASFEIDPLNESHTVKITPTFFDTPPLNSFYMGTVINGSFITHFYVENKVKY